MSDKTRTGGSAPPETQNGAETRTSARPASRDEALIESVLAQLAAIEASVHAVRSSLLAVGRAAPVADPRVRQIVERKRETHFLEDDPIGKESGT